MKEMMIRLPMIELAAADNVYLSKHYPQSGRYIIRRDNGDVTVADVQLPPLGEGCARSDDETSQVFETFIGQPDLLDPDDWALAIDIENIKLAARADVENIKCEMEDLKSAHEDELRDKELDCQGKIDAARAEVNDHMAKINAQMAEMRLQMEKELDVKRTELEHEYEMKKMQLEMEVPKRFSQGEWVSGKTLTEIIKALTCKKED